MKLINLAWLALLLCPLSRPHHSSRAAGHGFRAWQDTARGLKDYYQDYFPIGVAVSPRSLNTDEAALIKKQFASLTPENAMKMGPIHPQPDRYFWAAADSIVAFAQRNQLRLRGHTLCWHQQTPPWIFVDQQGDTVSKAVLLNRLREHIHTVVERYKGKIYAWDVVNEAISDRDSEFYRPSAWYRICGPEFIARAFEYAHESDPEALLFYNDYNAINPVKRKKIIRMLQELRQQGVPVQAIGLQGHWAITEPGRRQLDETLADFSKTGLPMQITELDISVYPKEQQRRPARPGEANARITEQQLRQQADQYGRCFALFRKYRQFISGVTFWNISDRHSWLDNFPVRGRKDYPLLFDQYLQPKAAYWKVVGFDARAD